MNSSVHSKMPVIYLSHGGGPCFFMDWSLIGPADTWNKTAEWLKGLHHSFPKPKAIVVFSAHWEESEVTIQSGARPNLIYDYYGFPKHTYELKYPAPGSPELASRIQKLLTSAGISSRLDSKRGFDHGVFIPFKLIFPEAHLPIVQISLKSGLNPAEHIELGKALSSLRDEGVLLVGSGMSYHNLGDLFRGTGVLPISQAFDQWLSSTLNIENAKERNLKLKDWESAPYARKSHPREEHLIPLMVISGAAGDSPGAKIFSDTPMGAVSSAFQFD